MTIILFSDSSPVPKPESREQGEERGATPKTHQRAHRQRRVRRYCNTQGKTFFSKKYQNTSFIIFLHLKTDN